MHIFLVAVKIFWPTLTTASLFWHLTQTPTFHHLWWDFHEVFISIRTIKQFMIHSDMSLFLFIMSAAVAQILQKHDVSLVYWSKLCATNFYWYQLLQKLHGQLSDNFKISQQHFLNIIIVCWCVRPSRFGIVFSGCFTWYGMLASLMTLHMAETVLPIRLFQHL